jgi:hypothetical protein
LDFKSFFGFGLFGGGVLFLFVGKGTNFIVRNGEEAYGTFSPDVGISCHCTLRGPSQHLLEEACVILDRYCIDGVASHSHSLWRPHRPRCYCLAVPESSCNVTSQCAPRTPNEICLGFLVLI